jgi:hypothetical protein
VDKSEPSVTNMLDASDFGMLKNRCLELCNSAIVEVSKDVLFFEAKSISDKGTVS